MGSLLPGFYAFSSFFRGEQSPKYSSVFNRFSFSYHGSLITGIKKLFTCHSRRSLAFPVFQTRLDEIPKQRMRQHRL